MPDVYYREGKPYTLSAEQQQIQDEMVTVTFQTRADLAEMTDEDYANIGRAVADMAAEARAWAKL